MQVIIASSDVQANVGIGSDADDRIVQCKRRLTPEAVMSDQRTDFIFRLIPRCRSYLPLVFTNLVEQAPM